SDDSSLPAVVVSGEPQDIEGTGKYAIAVANGALLISASNRSSGSSTLKPGQYQLGGNVLAFGDVTLNGGGIFAGHQAEYTGSALHNPYEKGSFLSGELTMGGLASANGNLRLVATGDDPSEDVQHPSAIHLQGNFGNLLGGLDLDGSVDFKDATTIDAAGDVKF